MVTYVDYFAKYGRIMQFNKNKREPIHRWYPLVEGYSKEFITSIIDELDVRPQVCLEPFSGSGTTALELQKLNIQCHSFEINPFMHLLSSVKLENSYTKSAVQAYHRHLKEVREKLVIGLPESRFRTLYEAKDKKRWNYSKDVGVAVDKLRNAIDEITDDKYRRLFTVVLASILLDVSNLYRNGKCLSYKSGWKNRRLTEEDVFNAFDEKLELCIIPDISVIENENSRISNITFLHNEDSRVGINKHIEDESIDVVITSPPYLNSRDYTDTYMLELKTLGMTSTYESITSLRAKTIRSHVQICWDDNTKENDAILCETMRAINEAATTSNVWNPSIPDMINLYFVDMRTIFKGLYKKLKSNGRVYFNVSNSAYFGVLIDTLEICSSIAASEGFDIEEIRKARLLKTSPQQKDSVKSLLEGVIVMNKKVAS